MKAKSTKKNPKSMKGKTMINKKQKGYTLLEVLLSVAIILIMAGLSIPVFQSFQNRNDLGVATEILANNLWRAQIFSANSKEDSQWGIKTGNGKVILFKGNDYQNRDQIFDEIYETSTTLSFSGDQEIIFKKLSGEPDAPKSFILTNINGKSIIVLVNEKGTVNY